MLTVNGTVIPNFTQEDLFSAIEGLNDSTGGFVILEMDTAVKNVEYIQSALPAAGYDDGKGYIFEIGVQLQGKYHLYGYRTLDVAEIQALFLAFWKEQQLPDYSRWPVNVY